MSDPRFPDVASARTHLLGLVGGYGVIHSPDEWEIIPHDRHALGHIGERSHRGRLISIISDTELDALEYTIETVEKVRLERSNRVV